MDRTLRLFLLFIALFAGLISCKTYERIDIQLLQPATFEIPENIQSVAIMNRSLTPMFSNKHVDSLQTEFYRKDFEVDTVILDSTASDQTIRMLSNLLYDSERFDVVIPLNRNIPRASKYNIKTRPLEWDYVKDVCKEYNTDALLVLENFAVRMITSYDESYEWNSSGNPVSIHYASEDVNYKTYWRVYNPKSEQIIFEKLISDTIYWDSYAFTQTRLFSELPKVKEALIEAGNVAAQDLSLLIAPQWKAGKRSYFTKGKYINDGAYYAKNGEWEKAEESWRKYLNSTNNMVRSKLEYNIALAREMQGDINGAIEWGVKSFNTYFRLQTGGYLKELDKRKKELKQIKSNK